MRKKIIALICTAVLCITCVAVAGCGVTPGAKENELLIRYFRGGTGDIWLQKAAEKFEASHEGVTVKLEADNDIGGLAPSQMSSGKNVADIYFFVEFPWQEQVSLGNVANLESVYEAEVTTSQGKMKVKDYMLDDVRDSRYMSRYEGTKLMPWTMSLAFSQVGIVYNEDILFETTHTTAKAGEWAVGDKWTTAPVTIDDLLAYTADLNARNITPFTFSGKEATWFQRVMYGWWAQYQGAYELNTANSDVNADDGTFFDYWNYKGPEVFKQAGIRASIEAFQSLVCNLSTGKPKNTPIGVMANSTQDAVREFVQQKCAMVFSGAFLYNEISDLRDMDGDGQDDFTMKMMNLPFINGAQLDENGDPLKMNLYNSEDVILVPSKATNLELAKKFLVLLCEEESLLNFTKYGGDLRPFRYDPMIIDGVNGFNYSPFVNSIVECYNESDVHLIRYPSRTPIEDVSYIYQYLQPLWDNAETSLNSILFTTNASSIVARMYQGAQKEWSKWETQVA